MKFFYLLMIFGLGIQAHASGHGSGANAKKSRGDQLTETQLRELQKYLDAHPEEWKYQNEQAEAFTAPEKTAGKAAADNEMLLRSNEELTKEVKGLKDKKTGLCGPYEQSEGCQSVPDDAAEDAGVENDD